MRRRNGRHERGVDHGGHVSGLGDNDNEEEKNLKGEALLMVEGERSERGCDASECAFHEQKGLDSRLLGLERRVRRRWR